MRTKDLVDLVLMIEANAVTPEEIGQAVRRTFARRKAHGVPTELSPPPARWDEEFETLANEVNLEAKDTAWAFEVLRSYGRTCRNELNQSALDDETKIVTLILLGQLYFNEPGYRRL